MENLLLLVHRIPYPPNKGDKIQSYHLLKHLAQHYRVHLATFVDDPDDWQHVPRVKALCAESHFAFLNPKLARVRSLGALLGNRSLSLDYYRNRGLKAWVDEVMKRQQIDRILVFSSVMAQYAEGYPSARRVVDFLDVDSDKWRQYSEQKSWPMNWLYRYEARQLLQYERKVASDCDVSFFVSKAEADLFKKLAPESIEKIGVVSIGIDTEYFSPERVYENPFPNGERVIVFTGAMDYWPNIDAVKWFATDIFPLVQASCPDARFYIVGTRPSPEVRALAQAKGIVVTGTVPDVRPFIAHSAMAVAPLRVARGVQTKVLEAMALGKRVVVSPQALEGIDAIPGTELLLAEDAAQFAETVLTLMVNPDTTIGGAARARVERQYSTPGNMTPIDASLETTLNSFDK